MKVLFAPFIYIKHSAFIFKSLENTLKLTKDRLGFEFELRFGGAASVTYQ